MAEFIKQDLSGARFEQVDFSRAWFRNVYFTGATLRGAWLQDVDIDGEIRNVRVNGVDIGPLVEAELNRRHPDRTKLDPADADGFREAWAIIERVWPPTIERAERLPADVLHERVEDEYSFIETLRHLVFATDAWVRRAVLGVPDPYSPLGLPDDEAEPDPSVPNDRHARPSLHEMLELRADRMRTVHDVMATSPTMCWPVRPTRARRRATRLRAATRCVAACARSSTRSGCTAYTPNVTSPSSNSAADL